MIYGFSSLCRLWGWRTVIFQLSGFILLSTGPEYAPVQLGSKTMGVAVRLGSV